VGWPAWNVNEHEAHERWRVVHWREQYSMRSIAALALIAACLAMHVLVKVAR
jgi:hypothetical protein